MLETHACLKILIYCSSFFLGGGGVKDTFLFQIWPSASNPDVQYVGSDRILWDYLKTFDWKFWSDEWHCEWQTGQVEIYLILFFHEYFQIIISLVCSIYMNTFKDFILLVWVQRHPNIALYCRFQNQSQSGKGRTSISGYERSSTADHIFWFRASTWFQNKEMFLKFSFSKLHPPTRTIFFEVQIHSLSSSTEIKITETSLLHNFLQLLKFASQYLTSGETS